MPRRLNRKNYGWSYTYGRDQRTPSKEYTENIQKVHFPKLDTSDWPTRQTRFGKARVKVFA